MDDLAFAGVTFRIFTSPFFCRLSLSPERLPSDCWHGLRKLRAIAKKLMISEGAMPRRRTAIYFFISIAANLHQSTALN
jgi:hypothetical protein